MTDVQKRAQQRGIICVLTAALLYSIGGLCIKLIPWNGMSINSARNIISATVVGFYLLLTHHKLRFNRFIGLGALCVSGTNILYSLANKLTTAANAIVLQFTAPIFVILLSILFWKRKPKKLDVIACLVVLAGVICFFIDGLEMGGMLGNGLALLSGLSYAGVFLLNDMPDGDPLCSIFWGFLVSVVAGFPFLVQETVFTTTAIVSVIALGALQVGLAYILMCIGLRTTPPVTASMITGIEPILNPIWVAIFYHEMIGPMALIGAAIVIITVIVYNVQKAKHPA